MSKRYNSQELYNKYSKNKKNFSQNSFNNFFIFSLLYPFGAIAVFTFVFVATLTRDSSKAIMIIHNGAFICIIVCLVIAMSLSLIPISIKQSLLKKNAKNTENISSGTGYINYSNTRSSSPSISLYVAYIFQAIIVMLLVVGTAVVIYCFMIFFDFSDNFFSDFVGDILAKSFGKLFE